MTDTERLDWLSANPEYIRALMWKACNASKTVRQGIDELAAEKAASRETVTISGVEYSVERKS